MTFEHLISQSSPRPTTKRTHMLSESASQFAEKIEYGEGSTADTPVPKFKKWSKLGHYFYPLEDSTRKLPSGFYQVRKDHTGLYMEHTPVCGLDDIIEFPDSIINSIVEDATKFFDNVDKYKAFSIPHKRGLLLYGPPGGGKSCAVKMVCKKLIKNWDGIIINWSVHPEAFFAMAMMLRSVEPTRPMIVIMEDLDSLIEIYNESSMLNVLDGVTTIDHTLFLATTNYPEVLERRLSNRPGRFDRRIFLALPNPEMRKTFLSPYLTKANAVDQLDKWVKDTDGFTFAHIKELFKSVYINNWEYTTVLKELKAMFEKVQASDNFERSGKGLGFGKKRESDDGDY